MSETAAVMVNRQRHHRTIAVTWPTVLLLIAGAAGCHRHVAAKDAVPMAHGVIAIDGEWEEPDWVKVALREQFHGADGQLSRPSSEVRFLRDDRHLLVAMYAADENIETSDAFQLSVGKLALRFDARGQITPATPEVHAAVGFDEGTVDDPRDDDEEWVVEASIPLDMVGRGSVPVRASRCDTPKDGVQRCGSWSDSISLP